MELKILIIILVAFSALGFGILALLLSIGKLGQCTKCLQYSQYLGYSWWCKSCQLNNLKKNFTNWTSGNEKIDYLIQSIQLQIINYKDIIFEWIPYNQLINIKEEIEKNDFSTEYSAKWKGGPLNYDLKKKGYIRNSDKTVTLKCLGNSINITEIWLNKILNKYSVKRYGIPKIYGISQNPSTEEYIMILENKSFEKYCVECIEIYTDIQYKWCNPCQINYLKKNFTNWTSENERIDYIIQNLQLEISKPSDIVFEWISYNQFYNIREIYKDDFATVYSAEWKDGPLIYDNDKKKWIRESEKKVALKCLHNSKNINNEFLNEVKKYLQSENKTYGISQNPYTKDYIMVFHNKYFEIYCGNCDKTFTNIQNKWCNPCQVNYFKERFTSWTSGNEEIDNLIQEIQLKISKPSDIILEWISYDQFNDVKEICKGSFVTIYSAVWKDGPLNYDNDKKILKRESDKKVALKYLHNSQNIFIKFLNEIEKYSRSENNIYGISQNPDTKDYIIVLYHKYSEEYFKECYIKYDKIHKHKKIFTNWISGNEKVDDLIQEMQLKINSPDDIVFEWIPYNQFSDVEKIGKGGFATVYSAIWKDGPLYYKKNKEKWARASSKAVALKCLDNSQNITGAFLNEIKAYSINNFDKILQIYGISQNPDTKEYIMVLQYAEVLSNIINGLEKIHQKQMVHRDFHIGNILFEEILLFTSNYISDMGLCGEIGNIDETNIYGVIPYVAPEVLRGKPYTQAADIYSFGMIMYFVATGNQPFSDRAHDEILVLDICEGVRPELEETEAPKCYIDLMEKCWDSNPVNRLNATKIEELIKLFYNLHCSKEIKQDDNEIEKQFKEAEKYRSTNQNRNNKSTIHPQAIYTSRLLNPFTKDLPEYIDDKSDCLDCAI